jgi:membrane protein
MNPRPWLERADRLQRSRPWLAFPVGVAKKFGDDRAGSLAALIAYYGFFSLFPLLLALTTAAGLVLRDDPELRDRLVGSALAQLPMIGDRIGPSIRALDGDGWIVAFSLLLALWSGLAGIGAGQQAMDDVWDVPRRDRGSFVRTRLRALAMLLLLGTFVLGVTVLGTIGATLGSGWPARAIVFVVTVAMNATVVLLAMRLLTVARPSWVDLAPGAVAAGVAWTILQSAGGAFVEHRVQGAGDVYGFFAIVIGLLAWLYLAAQVLLVAAEVNVVRARRLWPRRLFPPPLEPADRRVVEDETREAVARPEANVEVSFSGRGEPTTGVRSERAG